MTDEAKPQLDKFKELARQLEADEDEKAFEARLKRIAKATPDNGQARRRGSSSDAD